MLGRVLLLICLLTSLNPVFAKERRYLAPMEESRWQMTVATALHCEMEHEIPRFGKAIFYQSAGRDLQLKLVTQQRFKSGIEVDFRSQSPNWKSVFSDLQMASLSTRDSDILLKVGTRTAKYAYLELHDGFHSGFHFTPDKDLIDPTVVMMSTVRFRSVEPDFERCVSNLYYENYEDVRVSSIHFDHDEEFPILQEEETALQRMYDYIQVDPSIREIVISGHADKTGTICYNDTLSSRRAWYVYDLLLAKGIDPKIITLDHYGEHRPLEKGESDSALAANRRVTLELLK
ncbi:MAG: OmpA family protein [Gammaproteobacteria bacterium]|nr:OmpA family protein [Gammaproteobacteria bacterium]